MTEDEENLRKFLESDDPALVQMGLSMAKGSGLADEMLGEILWTSTFHKNKKIREVVASSFSKLTPKGEKKPLKKDFTDVENLFQSVFEHNEWCNLIYGNWSNLSTFKEFYMMDKCLNPKQRLINTILKFLDKDIGKNWSVKELKTALKRQRLKVSGKKTDLIARFFGNSRPTHFVVLGKLDWKPTDEYRIEFLTAYEDWTELIKLGKPAIEPLCEHITSIDYSRYYDLAPVIALREIGNARNLSENDHEKIDKGLDAVVKGLVKLLQDRTLYPRKDTDQLDPDYLRDEPWERYSWEDSKEVITDLGEIRTLSAVKALENISFPVAGPPDIEDLLTAARKNATNNLSKREQKRVAEERKARELWRKRWREKERDRKRIAAEQKKEQKAKRLREERQKILNILKDQKESRIAWFNDKKIKDALEKELKDLISKVEEWDEISLTKSVLLDGPVNKFLIKLIELENKRRAEERRDPGRMTDDASPENLRKLLASGDPARVMMGLSMAKGSEVPEELLGLVAGCYVWHDDEIIRTTAKSIFMKYASKEAKLSTEHYEQNVNAGITYSWDDYDGDLEYEDFKKEYERKHRNLTCVFPLKIFNNHRDWMNKPLLEFFVNFELGDQNNLTLISCGHEYSGEFKIEFFTDRNSNEETQIISDWIDHMDNVKNDILGPNAMANVIHWSPEFMTYLTSIRNSFSRPTWLYLHNLPWLDLLEIMKRGTIAVKGVGLFLTSSRFELKEIAMVLYNHGLIAKDYVKEPSTSEFMWELINYLRCNHT